MKPKKPTASPSSEPPARSSSGAGPASRTTPSTAPGRARHRRFWFRLVAIAVPLANLVLLEFILRLCGYGYSSGFFLKTSASGQPVFVDNQQFARRYFPRGLERTPRPLVLSATKPAGTLRVFVFGESAAMGDPEPAFGFARILEVLLREAWPGQPVEVVNVAVTAINSHAVREIARDCAGKGGDYWLVYMGNNEVVGPFGAGTVFGEQTPRLGFIRANLALKTTRLGQLLDALREALTRRSGIPTNWEGMEMFLKQQVPQTDPRMARVYAHFESNLRDIVRLGRNAGAQVLLSTVACNLKDSPPFGSAHRPGLTEAQAAEWTRSYQAGVELERAGHHAAALTNYLRAAQVDNAFAELAFRMGRCFLALGELDEARPEALEGGPPRAGRGARRQFEEARDLDTLRFRADGRINQIIRTVAAGAAGGPGGTGTVLVDAAAILATNSPGNLTGAELFYEHVHLNFTGNYLLARAFAAEILQSRPGGLRGGATYLSEPECTRRLVLTDEERLQVLEEVAKRLRQAPFTSQVDHEIRDRKLQVEMDRLAPARKPEAFAAADAVFREALARAPDDWTLRENHAQFLQAHGRMAEAEPEWRKLIQLLPHSEHPYYGLANLLDTLGRPAEAVPYFQAALQRRPGSVEVLNGLGLALANQGDNAGATRQYERALHTKPDFAEARVNLGQLLAREGRETEAAAQYQETLRLQSSNVAAHVNLGKLLAGQGKTAEAVEHYRTALQLNPANAIAHYNLGNALRAQGDLAGAVTHYAEAARLMPEFGEAHYNLGICLAQRNQSAEALIHLAEASRLRPDMSEARFNYGVALAKARRYDEAIREFQETLRLEPANDQARKFLDQAQSLLRQNP